MTASHQPSRSRRFGWLWNLIGAIVGIAAGIGAFSLLPSSVTAPNRDLSDIGVGFMWLAGLAWVGAILGLAVVYLLRRRR